MHTRAFKHRPMLEKTSGIFLKSAAGGEVGRTDISLLLCMSKSDLLSDPYTIRHYPDHEGHSAVVKIVIAEL